MAANGPPLLRNVSITGVLIRVSSSSSEGQFEAQEPAGLGVEWSGVAS